MGGQVVKFGGSSLSTTGQILAVATRLVEAQTGGHRQIVVVSARGNHTDRLSSLASEVSDRPPARELDLLLSSGEQVSAALLSMAVIRQGGAACALLGSQCGLMTDGAHGRARLLRVSTRRLERELEQGRIPIVAGFQGISLNGEITTLGRGGSDTTAVAIANSMGWSCAICTDVDGIYSADPAVVATARHRAELSYEEAVELSLFGGRVLHWEAARLAASRCVPVRIQATFGGSGGTRIIRRHRDSQGAVAAMAATRRTSLQLHFDSRELRLRTLDLLRPTAVVGRPDRRGRVPLLVETDLADEILERSTGVTVIRREPVDLISLVGPRVVGCSRVRRLLTGPDSESTDWVRVEETRRRITMKIAGGRVNAVLNGLHESLEARGLLQADRARRRAS